MDELLQALIQEHSRRPRHFGKLPAPPARHFLAVNPLCGDEVDVFAQISGEIIENIKFDGAGCAISQASASLLASECLGKTVTEVATWVTAMEETFRATSLISNGEMATSPAFQTLPQAIQLLEPLKAFPRRVPCVLCAWDALKHILASGHSVGNS